MGALFTVSYWITLVTVIPGLVTIAALWGGLASVNPAILRGVAGELAATSEWVMVSIAVTIMVLTQCLGILLEELLLRLRLLGRGTIRPHGICPYEQYGHLYYLLVRVGEKEDVHGHMRRAIAQFFLTVNTLVSFLAGAAGACLAAALAGGAVGGAWGRAGLYTAAMGLFAVASYSVAVIRFREMARSIWAARQAGPGRDGAETGYEVRGEVTFRPK